MNKKSFIREYRKLFNSSKEGEGKSFKEAEMDLEIFLESLKKGLVKEKKIKLQNKGRFEVFQKRERIISNPSTREIMRILPPKTVKLIFSKKVINRINEISK